MCDQLSVALLARLHFSIHVLCSLEFLKAQPEFYLNSKSSSRKFSKKLTSVNENTVISNIFRNKTCLQCPYVPYLAIFWSFLRFLRAKKTTTMTLRKNFTQLVQGKVLASSSGVKFSKLCKVNSLLVSPYMIFRASIDHFFQILNNPTFAPCGTKSEGQVQSESHLNLLKNYSDIVLYINVLNF